MKKFFIQSNKSQYVGALLGKYAIERASKVPVEIILVDTVPAFQEFSGKTYLQGNEERVYSLEDEQSFTLTRLMPPQLMSYEGHAIVIDPDVFAVKNPDSLFDIDMKNKGVACCRRENFWDSSVMLLDCNKTKWKIENILSRLGNKEINYNTVIRELLGEDILEISRNWNSLDTLTDETHFIHYTKQRTQPWKTGLSYTVTPRKLGKFFGLIPKEWLPKGKERYPKTYQPHPDKKAERFFFSLLKDAIANGAITEKELQKEVKARRVRPDILEKVHASN